MCVNMNKEVCGNKMAIHPEFNSIDIVSPTTEQKEK